MKYKKNKKKKRGFKLKHVIILFLIFIIGKTFITQRIMMKNLIERKEKEEMEIAKLEKEIKELNEEIQDRDSLEFIEKIAREDLNMLRPREIMYIDKNKNKNHFVNFRTKVE
ncbi:cell division protein FtsL [Keratinibaculum paraultunense]|uniref:Cell division protein FtsL n=1 Tax=Keratinibaculum paraultunense TaxID=1278232 RepID=A0A4R3KT28_9FIRM|nr:septum formation initiator family protein [Keratinibaculum paraultunense]QQY79487.1 cell division protein FtsL [Keratinibaculum paraultunense]TCS88018.1 cell division protein FtsL [Keratinibaculum paraultunense]